jgi:uncharacterized protein YjbI with pentapeptide repeats
MIVACCGLILLSAVSAYAEHSVNGVALNGTNLNGASLNGASLNGVSLNGISLNGASLNGFQYRGEPSPSVQSENLPWNTLSHKRLGKSSN